ncbi:MAG: hypothetical protein HOC63_15235 [Rhodospirillales bacterium]|jgi:hypothetical protein|nr:hypothetical protein [Rhodospirillales bacterium]MBT4040749.1 hypothetical protein [Rhodospirillales bacterium]MBT4628026.1 hypothetical protein [Rhodospirillales bacterium]MBT5352584.1 hypothetical protein [Rhodospirillales bacterium]MBT5520886.1 hypothetical protein [Rhodospirillales bacterium]
MMATLGAKKEAPLHPPVDIKWIRNPAGKFHNLMMLEIEIERLQGVPGVFVIWRGGIKPEWLYAGSTQNLDHALNQFINDPHMEEHYNRGRVYVSWAQIKVEYQPGVVRYLNEVMKPEIEAPEVDDLNRRQVPMIAVFLPGLER